MPRACRTGRSSIGPCWASNFPLAAHDSRRRLLVGGLVLFSKATRIFPFEDNMNVSIRLLLIGLFCLALTAGCDNGDTKVKQEVGNDNAGKVDVKTGPQPGKKLPKPPPIAPPK